MGASTSQSQNLTSKEDLQEAFHFLDPNQTGFISNEKIQFLLQALHLDVTEEEVSNFSLAMNTKSVGKQLNTLGIDLNEVENEQMKADIMTKAGMAFQAFEDIILTPDTNQVETERWATEEFCMYDQEGKDFASEADIRRVMNNLGAQVNNTNIADIMDKVEGIVTKESFMFIRTNQMNPTVLSHKTSFKVKQNQESTAASVTSVMEP